VMLVRAAVGYISSRCVPFKGHGSGIAMAYVLSTFPAGAPFPGPICGQDFSLEPVRQLGVTGHVLRVIGE